MSNTNSHEIKYCQIFAHRGIHDVVMENTRSAFDKAIEYPIDGIETDVQLTWDEVAVLWHDRFLDKLGLPQKHIDDFDYLQLKQFSIEKSADSEIMRLQDFLDAYQQRCHLLLEIKNRDWESVDRHKIKVRQTIEQVEALSNPHQIFVSSFNLASLAYAHQFWSEVPHIYNIEPTQTLAEIQRVLTAQPFLRGYCLPIEILDQAIFDLLRDHDKCIAVYTCNSDEQINQAIGLGVDILISDVPQRALTLRDA